MANLFIDLPATVGDGVGAAQDTSALGKERTITIQGVFIGTVLIEVSCDGGATFVSAAGFTTGGRTLLPVGANRMRVRRVGSPSANPGLPNVEVAGENTGGVYTTLPAPAGDGVGAGVDTSTLAIFKTVTCQGSYTGTVLIEVSEDNVDWTVFYGFTPGDGGFQSQEVTAQFMRVRRTGTLPGNPGLPIVAVGSAFDSGGASTVSGPELLNDIWSQNDVAASQTNVVLSTQSSQLFDTFKAIRAGSIIGLSTRFTTAIATGQAVVTVTKNGVAGTLSLTHTSVSNASGGIATQLTGVESFVAGDLIGVQITTDGAFGPVTTDLEAILEVFAS